MSFTSSGALSLCRTAVEQWTQQAMRIFAIYQVYLWHASKHLRTSLNTQWHTMAVTILEVQQEQTQQEQFPNKNHWCQDVAAPKMIPNWFPRQYSVAIVLRGSGNDGWIWRNDQPTIVRHVAPTGIRSHQGRSSRGPPYCVPNVGTTPVLSGSDLSRFWGASHNRAEFIPSLTWAPVTSIPYNCWLLLLFLVYILQFLEGLFYLILAYYSWLYILYFILYLIGLFCWIPPIFLLFYDCWLLPLVACCWFWIPLDHLSYLLLVVAGYEFPIIPRLFLVVAGYFWDPHHCWLLSPIIAGWLRSLLVVDPIVVVY